MYERPGLIDSPHNKYVRFFRSLHTTKGRRERKCFLAEGARLVAEALAAGWPIVAAAICDQLLRPASQPVAEALRSGPWPCLHMTPRAFKSLSAEPHPQGVAIAAEQRLVSLEAMPLDGSAIFPVAWNISDPGNMGALIRTTEFFGLRALIAVAPSVDFFDPKTVRATAGAIFHLPLARTSADDFLAWAASAGVQIVATTASGGLPPDRLGQSVLEGPMAVLFGSEAHGLPPEAVAAAHAAVTIPRTGRVESLNVAVAAGIILWHLASRR